MEQTITIDENGDIHGLVHRNTDFIDLSKIECKNRLEERVSDIRFDSSAKAYYVYFLIGPRADTTLKNEEGAVMYFNEYDEAIQGEIKYFNELRMKSPELIKIN